MIDLFEGAEDIARQEAPLEEVAANAEAIYEMTEQERAEYRRLMMSFTGSSINIDISREVHRNFILADPTNRLIKIKSADDIVSLLAEIDRRDINIDDIQPQFLLDPRILEYFSQGGLRGKDILNFPVETYRSQELCIILARDKPYHWDTIFFKIIEVHREENSLSFLHALIFENPEIF
jgi:hypothetical protein